MMRADQPPGGVTELFASESAFRGDSRFRSLRVLDWFIRA